MSWITERDIDWETVAEEAGREAARAEQGGPGAPRGGRIVNIMSCMSINARALQAVRNMNANITFGASALTRVQEEAISTTVSVANHCRY